MKYTGPNTVVNVEQRVEDPDFLLIRNATEGFQTVVYGDDYYSRHNQRMLNAFEGVRLADGHDFPDVIEKTIVLHDFVTHFIVEPEQTAAKLGLTGDEASQRADELRVAATVLIDDLLAHVANPIELEMAYTFAFDAASWEKNSQAWREDASERIGNMVVAGEIEAKDAAIYEASVVKSDDLKNYGEAEIKAVIKKHPLGELRMSSISETAVGHNLLPLVVQGLEMIDKIQNPPKGNPAATFRDANDALSFLVPALYALGYNNQAADLRGAALEWMHEDPGNRALKQHAVSTRYFPEIAEVALAPFDTEFAAVEVQKIKARTKRQGSIREKLARKGYEGVDMVPDGNGIALVFPDDMSGEALTKLAQDYATYMVKKQPISRGRIAAEHPRGDDPIEDTQAKNGERRSSGYKSIHLNFCYYPQGTDESVPYEVQFMTTGEYQKKQAGPWSDLYHKSRATYDADAQEHEGQLARRARAERTMRPGSTIRSIANMIARSPGISSPFNQLYQAIETANGGIVLARHDIGRDDRDLIADLDKDFCETGELTVLPLDVISEDQFLHTIEMFSGGLMRNPAILYAMKLVKESTAAGMRTDGITPVYEGHILPTTLHSTMLAAQSGSIWREGSTAFQTLSQFAITGLTHDHLEARLEPLSQRGVLTPAIRANEVRRHRNRFDTAVATSVDALTVPFDVPNQEDRRDQFADNIRGDFVASHTKPSDRAQNHETDFARHARGEKDTDAVLKYIKKTYMHQHEDFMALPAPYRRVHELVMRRAVRLGFDPSAAY